MYIERHLEKVIKKNLFKKKVLVLYGARQTGKTTLIKHILEDFKEDQIKYVDCELIANNELLANRDDREIFSFVKGYKIVVFDEAQTVKGIGSVLKILFDHNKNIQFIATGSSSFDLANEVSEPLTGRSLEFILYPIAISELAKNNFEAERELQNFLRYGGYPGVLNLKEEDKERDLNLLVTQYLYKNILAFEGLKKPELVVSLLKLLAYQIGQEVSYRELSSKLETSVQTIQKYINLLENNFVIFRLKAFSKNGRREVAKTRKIYFTDLGLRNALVNNFGTIKSGRTDIGFLFENAMILERLKYLSHNGQFGYEQNFWRTINMKEVDYVENLRGALNAFEFKLGERSRLSSTKQFKEDYPEIKLHMVNVKNCYDFIIGDFENLNTQG
ncbi:MAG: ATP-binding protein [Patescibacteria group bacterium]